MERIARPCGCAQVPVLGAKRPKLCTHGNLFEKERPERLGRTPPRVRKQGLKRTQPQRDWVDALAKVEMEGRCRVCGWEGDGLEAGHVMGRKHDEPAHLGTKTLYVNPLRIVPLCPVFAPEHCHQSYDEHQLDLMPFLAVEEQVKAVEDAGSIESARRRLCPSAYRLEAVA